MRRNGIRNLVLGTAIASTALYAGLGAQQAAAPAGRVPRRLSTTRSDAPK
jgi:hypothetical protein